MTGSVSQIVLLLLGLGLVFFGLPLFRGALSFFGFMIGALYGLFFFSLFAGAASLTPILTIILALSIALVGGLLGMALANFANSIFIFIAGGFVSLAIAKILTGFPIGEAIESLKTGHITTQMVMHPIDFVWFIVGGIVFVMAIDTVMTIALVTLGSILIYQAIKPIHIFEPAWVIPAAFGVLGFLTQESLRHRVMKHEQMIVLRRARH
jgi:hypothetical protein